MGFFYIYDLCLVNNNMLDVGLAFLEGSVKKLKILKNLIMKLENGVGKSVVALDDMNSVEELVLFGNIFETSVPLFRSNLKSTTTLTTKGNSGGCFVPSAYSGRNLTTSYTENATKGIIRYNSKSHAETDYAKMTPGTIFSILNEGQTPAYTLWYFESASNVFQLAYKT